MAKNNYDDDSLKIKKPYKRASEKRNFIHEYMAAYQTNINKGAIKAHA